MRRSVERAGAVITQSLIERLRSRDTNRSPTNCSRRCATSSAATRSRRNDVTSQQGLLFGCGVAQASIDDAGGLCHRVRRAVLRHREYARPRCRTRSAHRQSASDGNATRPLRRTSARCASRSRGRAVGPFPARTQRWPCSRRSRETPRCATPCRRVGDAAAARRAPATTHSRARAPQRRCECLLTIVRIFARAGSCARRRWSRRGTPRAAPELFDRPRGVADRPDRRGARLLC